MIPPRVNESFSTDRLVRASKDARQSDKIFPSRSIVLAALGLSMFWGYWGFTHPKPDSGFFGWFFTIP
jgi:hypothetical protein